MISKNFRHLDPGTLFQGTGYVFRADQIEYLDITNIETESILVKLRDRSGPLIQVQGFDALDLVWRLKPGCVEGKRLKFPKYSWFVHNMFAHPLMQFIALFGFTKAAMWIHDVTVPKPLWK